MCLWNDGTNCYVLYVFNLGERHEFHMHGLSKHSFYFADSYLKCNSCDLGFLNVYFFGFSQVENLDKHRVCSKMN